MNHVRPRLKLLLLSPWTRWTALVVIVAVALAVALWPRGGEGGAGVAPSPPTTSPAQLRQAREAAALTACPTSGTGGGPLATVTLTCLGNGAQVSGGELFGGRPVLLNVWASWCAPCRTELPVLAGYAQRHGSVPVVTVQVKSGELAGLDLLARLGVHLPAVYDGDGALSAALHLPDALPASYLVDAGGVPHLVEAPRVFDSLDQVTAAVAKYGAQHE